MSVYHYLFAGLLIFLLLAVLAGLASIILHIGG